MGKYVKKVCNWRVLQVLQNSDKMGLKNPNKKRKENPAMFSQNRATVQQMD